MFGIKSLLRSLACGLVLAALGFTFALATSRSIDAPAAAGSRIVGSSTLRFLNAILVDNNPPTPDLFDLGDAAYGSFITRYVSVTGGVRPYRMSGSSSLNTLLAPGSSLTLGAGGCLMGTIVAPTNLTGGFAVIAQDSTGTIIQSLTGQFVLNLIAAGNGTFRFAMDRLNNGVLGQSYISKVECIGGNAPVVYSVLAGTLTVNGAQVGVASGLEAIGLSMSADGTISGRPLVTGQVAFTAHAVDALKRVGRNRANTVADQVMTFNIEDNSIVASDVLITNCSVKGDQGKANKDTVTFSGYINLSGTNGLALNGTEFAFRIGGATYGGNFNLKGQVSATRGGAIIFADGSQLKASVNPRTGLFKGSIKKANLGKLVGADTLQDRGQKRLGMSTELCNFVIGSDTIEFASRVKGNKYSLDYKLGKSGRPLGGSFQMLNTYGKDGPDIAGNPGDAWRTSFLIVPRFGIDSTAGLDAVTSLRVRIGSRFQQTIPASALVSSKNGAVKLLPVKSKGPAVSKLTIDPRRFVGTLQTTVISQFTTGIPQAKVAADAGLATSPNFTLGVDVDRTGSNADFTGEYGKQLFLPVRGRGTTKPGAAKGQNQWVDQTNLR